MKKKQIRVYKKIGIVLFGILAIVLGKATWEMYQSFSFVQERYKDEVQKLDKLESRVGVLQSEIQYLSTETGINDELVETFPVKRPGEQVIILVKQEEIQNASLLETTNKNKPWWEFWTQ